MLLKLLVCMYILYRAGQHNVTPPHLFQNALEATVVSDLVSFVSPPLIHPVGPLRGKHCYVVPIGLRYKRLLQRVKSQAGARVPLLVAKFDEGQIQKGN